jgi:hypothetical protein
VKHQAKAKVTSQDPRRGQSKDDLIALLDAEITHASSEANRSGLSLWALYAALAGVVWALLSEPSLGVVDVRRTILIVITLCMAGDLLNIALAILRAPRSTIVRYVPLSRAFEHSPRCSLFFAVRSVLFLVALWSPPLHYPRPIQMLGTVAYTVWLMSPISRWYMLSRAGLAGVIVSVGKVADYEPPPKTPIVRFTVALARAVRGGIRGAQLLFLVVAVRELVAAGRVGIDELKLGFLSFAALYLVHHLAHASEPNALVEDLIHLRRLLHLQLAEPAQIGADLEVRLLGFRASPMLSLALAQLTQAIETTRTSIYQLRKTFEELDDAFQQPHLNGERILAMVVRLRDESAIVQANFAQKVTPLEKHYRRATTAVRMAGEIDELTLVERRLDEEVARLKKEAAQLAERRNAFMTRIGKLKEAHAAKQLPNGEKT